MYNVAIRNNKTNEVRLASFDLEWADHSEDMFTEGNYGCDCNQSVFFAEAAGDDTASACDIDCSEHLYTALYAQLENGNKINLEA